ncbi:Ig domain-containing protein [Streptomyces piniterrae]|nr:Ig domain-containing protein [Streptomyces piniterrae]
MSLLDDRRRTAGDRRDGWPSALTFSVEPFDQSANAEELSGRAPGSITVLRPSLDNPATDQLFLDRRPVPRDAWSLDLRHGVLAWTGVYGGGRITLDDNLRTGHGLVGPVADEVGVSVVYKKSFTCRVAEDAGAQLVLDGDRIVGLSWDAGSDRWKSASWGDDALVLRYQVEPGIPPADPDVFSVGFDDLRCGDTWDPMDSDYNVTLHGSQDDQGNVVWKFAFSLVSGATAPEGCETGTPHYPYRFECVEPWSTDSLTGALLAGSPDIKGKVYGVKGEYVDAAVTGYYRLNGGGIAHPAVIGVFDGRLHVDDELVTGSGVFGRELVWSGLTKEQQLATGLPADGSLAFGPVGSSGTCAGEDITAVRLNHSELWSVLNSGSEQHTALRPLLAPPAAAAQSRGAGPGLDINTLLAMHPWAQTEKGEWYDQVQQGVRGDLFTIMNSHIPNDLWSLLFPDQDHPSLQGYLADVDATPVDGKPAAPWYESLSTAVLTQGLAGGTDPNVHRLNGLRAASWLRDQVAVSTAYQKHGDLLFHYHWKQIARNSTTQAYLDDQAKNTAEQQKTIDAYVGKWIDDMERNAELDPDDHDKLKALILEIGETAKSNSLYWAFCYYYRATHATSWANLQTLIGNPDGSTLTRLVQQNVSVLTALDSSGYFARKYFEALQVALSTTVFLQSIDFRGVAVDFSLIKLYLQKFVEKNINSANETVKAQAQKLQAMLAEEEQTHFIEASVDELRQIAGVKNAQLPFGAVATEFVKWFETSKVGTKFAKWGKVFGGLLMSGMTGLALNNLLGPYKDWKNLTAAQRAELITNTLQLAVQVVAAVAKGTVELYAVFTAKGLTNFQRFGALAWTTIGGESKALAEGMSKISNSMARWIGGASAGARAGAAAAEEASFLGKVMGSSLSEFVATRLGPLFVLAGMAFSIYNLTQGGSDLEIAAEVLNLVSGALTLFATFGGWLLASFVAEAVISVIIPIVSVLAVVAALVGMAIGLYLMFKKPPNPIAQFVDDHAAPAGLAMRARCSAIDYAVQYTDKEQNLAMVGCRLGTGSTVLTARPDGTVGIGAADHNAATVWTSATNGVGLTQFFTLIDRTGSDQGLVWQYLSLLKDGSVGFRDRSTKDAPVPDVQSQYWVAGVTADAEITQDNNLKSLQHTLQPVYPDAQGDFLPENKKNYLVTDGNGVKIVENSGTTWTLTMAGLAPAAMTMHDISLYKGAQSAPSFKPVQGQTGSKPMTFGLKSGTLPSFLSLDSGTGEIKVTATPTEVQAPTSYTLVAENALGKTEAAFSVEVKAVS